MRHERLYLADIEEACRHIDQFLDKVDKGTFLSSELLRSAVLQKMLIIGEAAARLPQAFKQEHPEIAWPQIVGFRNIAIHAYFAIDWDVVWLTAVQRVPELSVQISGILARESE